MFSKEWDLHCDPVPGEMPSRRAIADESAELEAEVRLLLHGKRRRRYKIYFALHQETETVRI